MTIATSGPEIHLRLEDSDLLLFKSPYLPQWIKTFCLQLSRIAESLTGSAWTDIIGGSALIAHRLFACGLAFCALVLIRKARCPSSTAVRTNPNPFMHISLPFLPLCATLLIFVRWGAIEQLFILISLLSLSLMPPLESKLNTDHRQTQRLLVVFAAALACASSRTWSYTFLTTSLLWSFAQTKHGLALRRIIFAVLLTILIYGALFFRDFSYQSWVSHLTQRWFYLNEPRYVSVQWIGSALLVKAACLWLALLTVRRLIFSLLHKTLAGPEGFIALLSLVGTLHLAVVQKTPATADLLVLVLIFISKFNPSQFSPRPASAVGKLLLGAAGVIPAALFTMTIATLLLGAFLFASPHAHLLPELRAAASGVFNLIQEAPVLVLLTLTLGTMTFFHFIKLQTLNPILNPRLRLTYALLSGVAALLGASELRSALIWTHLQSTLSAVPGHAQLLFLPAQEPLIHLLPHLPHQTRLVTLYEGESQMHNAHHSFLLIPSSVSEVCQAAHWNIERIHGMFSLCDAGQGTILHLIPLN